MKLFYISQDVNNGYDSYDSAVVCAKDEEEARNIHPSGYGNDYGTWCDVKDVKVEYIGKAKKGSKKGVVCASFNAG